MPVGISSSDLFVNGSLLTFWILPWYITGTLLDLNY